jgi:hypothetical protein
MFGLLKENILNNLETIYVDKGEKDFKIGFNQFIKTIKESKDLKTYYNIYSLYDDIQFDNAAIAREFVEESVAQLKTLDKSQISRIEALAESTNELPKTSRVYYLDQLVFNNKLSIKERLECKYNLVESLVKESSNNEHLIDLITNADKKINESIDTLTEAQLEVVNLLVENDTDKINTYYKNLISETQDLIDTRIIESKDTSATIVNLVEAKKKLKSLSSEPTVSNIESILDLKGVL